MKVQHLTAFEGCRTPKCENVIRPGNAPVTHTLTDPADGT